MTTYTAADFAVSRFADFDTSDAIAMRSGSGRKPWVIPNGRVLSDAKMAADGWVPVREPSDLDIWTGKTCPESCEWRTRAEKPRPLTADAITDEMVERAAHCMAMQQMPTTYSLEPNGTAGKFYDDAREVLHAALTEPPKRPEGAEELETVIGLNAGKWTSGAEDVRALADLLASQGVRATGGN